MTLGEVLQLVAEYRREDPEATELYHDRLMKARERRYADISSIGVEHDLTRSYSTIEECQVMARTVLAGARMTRTETLPGTTAPDAIMDVAPGAGVFAIGEEDPVIDGVYDTDPVEADTDGANSDGPSTGSGADPETPHAETPGSQTPRKPRARKKPAKLARPTNLKGLK